MSSGASDYFRRQSYTTEIDGYTNLIKTSNAWDDKKNIGTYITNEGWKNRRSGRGIKNNYLRFRENKQNDTVTFEVIKPLSDWREWIKTFDLAINFKVSKIKDGYLVKVSDTELKNNPSSARILRQVFRKAAYCSGCKVCQINCRYGFIRFENNNVKITGCKHCLECHNLPGGCLLFDSLKIPQGEKRMKTINCFDDHAPKIEWLRAFFDGKARFLKDNKLGPNQLTKFKRFLSDAGLIDKSPFTDFAVLVFDIGWDSDIAQGLLLINLTCGNSQMEWYVKNLDLGRYYPSQTVIDMLLAAEIKEKAAKSIVKSFKRLTKTPLGTNLHFGYVTDNGDLVRTKCSVTDLRVVLYGLFKFAEKCNDYKEFTLATMLNDSIERDGVSPTRIFGLTREDAMPVLLGLSTKYPEFIQASFTHDLEKITLLSGKTSLDVLDLFKEDMGNG
jgi:phosphoadenosine phosphosulfate reductase